MRRPALSVAAALIISGTGPAFAQQASGAPAKPSSPVTVTTEPAAAAPPGATSLPPVVFTPLVMAIKQGASDRRIEATSDERQAVVALFEKRNGPLWTDGAELSARARAVVAEIGKAGQWGLPSAELLPRRLPAEGASLATPAELADAEWQISAAVLKYARYARGGRIAEPSKQLASYIDRTPQLVAPRDVLATLADATDAAAALRGFNPQHPQFLALRDAYAEALKSGTLDHVAFQRAVDVFRLRFPEASLREAQVKVAHMIDPTPRPRAELPPAREPVAA